ncbi:MAG TPA: 1-acyl-sn-glycerol-3-phosphate acyltransferase, partial [Candidatus Tectomicrobia bacterium]|nr:1-acyl-sn-glycerol-3-phosphate acyltransferase [Candidatus Tectomicrobia bacterium]
MGPDLVRALARALLRLFYRRLAVTGLEHVPRTGPVIVAANHQNGLVDAMLVLAVVPRRLRPLAKAPLFRHPLVAPFLRLAAALRVERRQDPGSDPGRNVETFVAVRRALAAGDGILIFPEGVSQPEPSLMTLRTGAARMLLDARAAGAPPVALVPVGLVFHEPGRFRDGEAFVSVGPPVRTDDCLARYADDAAAAVRELTDRLTDALRRQMVEADDRQTLRLLHLAERVWRHESGGRDEDRLAWMQTAARAWKWLRAARPADAERLRREMEAYAADLDALGVTPGQLSRDYAPASVARYVARELMPLVLGLPLALVGVALHALPYRLTDLAVRALRAQPDVEATYKIAAGVVLYPLAWGLEAWIALRVAGVTALVLFLAALIPTGLLAIAWRDRVASVRR